MPTRPNDNCSCRQARARPHRSAAPKSRDSSLSQQPTSRVLSETIDYLASCLDGWVDAVVCGSRELSVLRALADAATIPVINAGARQNHPFEVLGELAFLYGRRKDMSDFKVAVVAPDANILASWIEASAALPLQVIQVYPQDWHAAENSASGARFRTTTDANALLDADVIVIDRWPENANPEKLRPYQITASLLDRLSPDAEFLPCQPVATGQEVSADAISHATCHARAAKAFLLHAQNAALEWVFDRL